MDKIIVNYPSGNLRDKFGSKKENPYFEFYLKITVITITTNCLCDMEVRDLRHINIESLDIRRYSLFAIRFSSGLIENLRNNVLVCGYGGTELNGTGDGNRKGEGK